MSDQTGSNVYQFLLTRIQDKSQGEIPHISDFQYVAFVRDPIRRQSTFIEVFATVALSTITLIHSEISVGKYPYYELSCYLLTGEGEDNVDRSHVQSLIYSTTVVILCADIQKENISTSRADTDFSTNVKFLMVHPVAFQMSKNTGFNIVYSSNKQKARLLSLSTILNNDFNPHYSGDITSFTDYIINKYSASSNPIKQVVLGDRANLNYTNYNQISVPSTIPEINVAEYLINTYKPFNTPSYWFLDTFNFTNYEGSGTLTGKIPIWAILINFFNCINTFKKEDISINYITMIYAHLLKREEFIDSFGIFNRPNAIVNFVGSDMTTSQLKMGELPKTLLTDNSSVTQDSRETSFRIYYPDSVRFAKNRLVACRKLFTDQIEQIEFFETPQSDPMWLQFGKLYNIEYDETTYENKFKFIHTPIVILNIFKRRQIKDDTMENINKYAMLRLVAEQ
ncbi:MAG: hypothetical protein PHD05_00350 [Sphaerochaetaceae bacterium]|nr:hypothetical protein [Sphaerochaetaceae bacterium]